MNTRTIEGERPSSTDVLACHMSGILSARRGMHGSKADTPQIRRLEEFLHILQENPEGLHVVRRRLAPPDNHSMTTQVATVELVEQGEDRGAPALLLEARTPEYLVVSDALIADELAKPEPSEQILGNEF